MNKLDKSLYHGLSIYIDLKLEWKIINTLII